MVITISLRKVFEYNVRSKLREDNVNGQLVIDIIKTESPVEGKFYHSVEEMMKDWEFISE